MIWFVMQVLRFVILDKKTQQPYKIEGELKALLMNEK